MSIMATLGRSGACGPRRSVLAQAKHPGERRGFTLIELLVVIAIIALLIGLLLPAIARARRLGWQVQSLSNARSIATASFQYQSDFNGFIANGPGAAFFPTATGIHAYRAPTLEPGGTLTQDNRFNPPRPLIINAWHSWGWGGKNTANGNGRAGRSRWVNWGGGVGDVPAAARPLNRYVTDSTLPARTGPTGEYQQWLPSDPERDTFELEVFRDPSDRVSYQQLWGSTQGANPIWSQIGSENSLNQTISSYDDVGTSYHSNLLWLDQVAFRQANPTSPRGTLPPPNYSAPFGMATTRALWLAWRLYRAGDTFQPSQMAFFFDQYADIVIYNETAYEFKAPNGYGDFSRSVMGFMDGHAAYLPVFSRGTSANPTLYRRAFENENYSVIFEAF